MKKEKRKCVAPGLFADPSDCWVREGCKYWSKALEYCTYGELQRAYGTSFTPEAKDDTGTIE